MQNVLTKNKPSWIFAGILAGVAYPVIVLFASKALTLHDQYQWVSQFLVWYSLVVTDLISLVGLMDAAFKWSSVEDELKRKYRNRSFYWLGLKVGSLASIGYALSVYGPKSDRLPMVLGVSGMFAVPLLGWGGQAFVEMVRKPRHA